MLDKSFSKIVFLIGAGASKDAGCKLSKDMLNSLEETIQTIDTTHPEFNDLKSDFSEIYQFVLASLGFQQAMKGENVPSETEINIEDFVMVLRQLIDKEFILPYPLIGNWNEKITRWEMRNGDVFLRFMSFITKLLVSDWTQFSEDNARETLSPLVELLTSAEDFKINIFSLNYDLVLEDVFNRQEERVLDNGFSEKHIDNKRASVWAADFNGAHSPAKINLYKLHGSVDWEYDVEREEILIKENIDDGRDPLIIFGSFSKMLSFDPFLYILSKFRDKLSEATIFVIVGYSFHDKYINNLLIQQLSQNTEDDKPKRMLVVNPAYRGTSEAEFASLLESIQASKSIDDVINFRAISPSRIQLIPLTAKEFYGEYLGGRGEGLLKTLEEVEAGDQPFGA